MSQTFLNVTTLNHTENTMSVGQIETGLLKEVLYSQIFDYSTFEIYSSLSWIFTL